MRVVLGEDDFLAREGIEHVLGALDDVELVASCRDAETLADTLAGLDVDVVVVDCDLGGSGGGVRLAGELRSTRARVGVIVIAREADAEHARRTFAGGSLRRAFLLRDGLHDSAELGRAIREVASGGAVVDPRVIDSFVTVPRAAPRLASLTPREREILALIAAGGSNGAIAGELGITTRGVERHVHSLFAKLHLGERDDVSRRVAAALVFLSEEGRLVDGPPPP